MIDLSENLVGGSDNFCWLLDGATPPEGKGECVVCPGKKKKGDY